MKKLFTYFWALTVIFLFFAPAIDAQLFQQDFTTALTAGNEGSGTIISNVRITSDPVYVDSGAFSSQNTQFTLLSTNGTSASIEINGDGVMRLVRTGSSIYIVKNNDFDGPPSAIKVSFDFNAEVTNGTSNAALEFMLGSNFVNGNTNPSATDRHSSFFINTKNPTGTPGTWGVTPVNASSASAYTTTQTVVWVVNNSGQSTSYTAPDGSSETLGNDKYDVWVGNTKEIDEASALTPDTPLTDFEIRVNGGNGTYSVDNLLITELTAGSSDYEAGDYRSVGNGNWSAAATWEMFDGALWAPAVTAPSDTASVFINTGDTVTVDAPDTINGNLSVDGYLKDIGILIANGTNTFNNGSTYELAHASATGAGIPTATWNEGSTCLVTGVTSSTEGLNANQNFYNFTWNCPGQTTGLNVAWSGITISGNLTVNNSNGMQFRMTNSPAYVDPINILGDVIVDGATAFLTPCGSSGAHTPVINISGNINVTAGTYSLSNNSNCTVTHNVLGNVTFAGGTTFAKSNGGNGSKLVLNSGESQDISMTPGTFGSTVRIEIANGTTASLTSPLTFPGSGNIILTDGLINTTGTNLLTMSSPTTFTGGSQTSYINGPMAMTIASAASTTRSFPLGKGIYYRPVELTITQDAETATTYTAELFNEAPASRTLPVALTKVSSDRYINILKSAGANVSTATVTLNYDADDFVTDAPNLRIAKDDGSGGWMDLGGTGTANTTGTITSTANFTTFSDFVLANAVGGSNIIPVELTSFSASTAEGKVILSWSTATETNNKGFEVQRSEVGNQKSEWREIGFVSGSGTSSESRAYSFNDVNASAGLYTYRLKQIDYDGTFKYSNVIEVDVANTPQSFALHQNYPNPFNPETNIKFEVPEASFINISIYNALGEKVADLINEFMDEGRYTKSFNASELNSGIYFYQLTSNTKTLTKKMIVIK